MNRYSESEANNLKDKIVIEEVPNSENGAKTKELVPYKPSANAKQSKLKTGVRNFPSRKNITAIENDRWRIRTGNPTRR